MKSFKGRVAMVDRLIDAEVNELMCNTVVML